MRQTILARRQSCLLPLRCSPVTQRRRPVPPRWHRPSLSTQRAAGRPLTATVLSGELPCRSPALLTAPNSKPLSCSGPRYSPSALPTGRLERCIRLPAPVDRHNVGLVARDAYPGKTVCSRAFPLADANVVSNAAWGRRRCVPAGPAIPAATNGSTCVKVPVRSCLQRQVALPRRSSCLLPWPPAPFQLFLLPPLSPPFQRYPCCPCVAPPVPHAPPAFAPIGSLIVSAPGAGSAPDPSKLLHARRDPTWRPAPAAPGPAADDSRRIVETNCCSAS